MVANKQGPLEMAMTHYADGRECQRPKETRDMVSRLMGWDSHHEICQSCSHARATSVVGGEALCPMCKNQRTVRMLDTGTLDRVVGTRADPVDGIGLVGHSIVFDSWSVDLGGFIERVRPQAVNRMMARGRDVRALWNHNSDVPLGRSSAGTMQYWKDDIGVGVKIVPPQWAAHYLETVQRGDVTGMSFGFQMIEDEWSFDGKKPARDLLDIEVSEMSAVAFPAYPSTDLRVGDATRSVALLERWHRTKLAG